MKYGVIVYTHTKNIGDDIQSYAASRLLPRVDYYIEREHMDVFRPKENEPVSTIMNGWFMYNKLAWPISSYINPLYISMHFLQKDSLLVEDSFLKGLGGEDLIACGPVGARDVATLKMFERNQIPAYFSGCATLTLPKMKKLPGSAEEKPYVCLTDVPDEVENYYRRTYPDIDFRIIEHEPRKMPPLVKEGAEWTDRFRTVEELLTVYQNAQAVVTTRLHCAMPCLALETPVLLIVNDDMYEPDRISGLVELVRRASSSEIVKGNASFDLRDPGPNSSDYHTVREGIIRKVEDFVRASEDQMTKLMQRCAKYDAEWERRALWKDEILLQMKKRQEARFEEREAWIRELETGKNWLEQQYESQRQKLDKQENMLRTLMNDKCIRSIVRLRKYPVEG